MRFDIPIEYQTINAGIAYTFHLRKESHHRTHHHLCPCFSRMCWNGKRRKRGNHTRNLGTCSRRKRGKGSVNISLVFQGKSNPVIIIHIVTGTGGLVNNGKKKEFCTHIGIRSTDGPKRFTERLEQEIGITKPMFQCEETSFRGGSGVSQSPKQKFQFSHHIRALILNLKVGSHRNIGLLLIYYYWGHTLTQYYCAGDSPVIQDLFPKEFYPEMNHEK